MRYAIGACGFALSALLAATSPSTAFSLGVHANVGGASGTNATAGIGTSNSTTNANANVGLGNLLGNQPTTADVNANLGNVLGNQPATADVNLGVGNGGSTSNANDASVTADLNGLAGNNTGAVVTLGGDNDGLGANATLGAGSSTGSPTYLASDLDLLGGGTGTGTGTATTGDDITALAGLPDLGSSVAASPVSGAAPGAATGPGSLAAGNANSTGVTRLKLTSANCLSPTGKRALDLAAHTRYSGPGLRAWSGVANVKVVHIGYCAQLRQSISAALGKNGNIAAMHAVASDNGVIQRALVRSDSNAGHILLATRAGRQLNLYVF
jgi:hypothetical protein